VDEGDPVPGGSSFERVGGSAGATAPASLPAPESYPAGSIHWMLDCGTAVACRLGLDAGTPPRPQRILFGPWAPFGSRSPPTTTRERSVRSHGTRSLPPRLPAPDHLPQGPTAPGSSLGSGSSGGFQGGALLGLIAALLSLAPLWGSRVVAPLEGRRPAVHLASSLERPG
jgi:hypothetical protein